MKTMMEATLAQQSQCIKKLQELMQKQAEVTQAKHNAWWDTADQWLQSA